jgi:hypothetical protein
MQMFYWVGLTAFQDTIVEGDRRVTSLTLLIRALMTSLKFLDLFTDAGVVALVYRQYLAGECQWRGEQRCSIYRRQFALITTATCLAFLVVLLMKLLPAFAHSSLSRPALMALHCVALSCEICTLTVTGMQLVAAGANVLAATPLATQSVLFVLLSGGLTSLMFLLTVQSLYRSWAAEAVTIRAATGAHAVHPESVEV